MKTIERKTHLIDATDRPLGRLATEIAILLRGKHKPSFSLNVDEGDYVEIVNCDKLRFSGKKLEQKEKIWHTNYPGGLRREKTSKRFAERPELVLREAVMGMLPKNRLRDLFIKRLIIK